MATAYLGTILELCVVLLEGLLRECCHAKVALVSLCRMWIGDWILNWYLGLWLRNNTKSHLTSLLRFSLLASGLQCESTAWDFRRGRQLNNDQPLWLRQQDQISWIYLAAV